MTRWSRRRWLTAAAASVGLPWLEAFAPPARAASTTAPPRLLAFYVPNGMPMQAWTEERILAPLSPVRDEAVVVRGLYNAPADLDTAGHHAAGTAGMLTAARAFRSESHPQVGVSIDTIFAQAHGTQTSLEALALGTQDGDAVGNCDNGFSCAYSRHISWTSPTTPRAKIVDPRLAFDLLFRGYDPQATDAELARRRTRRTSVLDVVGAQASGLRGDLGASDRTKLDEYLDAVRDLERRVQAVPQCQVGAPPVSDDGGTSEDLPALVDQMIEIMVLALRCDATRAITFMLGNSASNRSFPFVDVPHGHHDLSHHQGDPEQLAALEVVSTWEIDRFAHLLTRLAQTPDPAGDGAGTLLDSTLCLLSSELSNGNSHTHDDLPVVVAGRAPASAGTTVQTDGASLGSLLLAMLHELGVGAEAVGDAAMPLVGVL